MDKNVTLLVVEDDDVDAEMIWRSFKKKKIKNRLVRVNDGVEALEVLRGEHKTLQIDSPFLMLVDLNMPRMGGIELIKNIRADKNLKRSLVIVLTTSKNEQDKVEAYELNVAGYTQKQNAGAGFLTLVDMIDTYWRIIEFP